MRLSDVGFIGGKFRSCMWCYGKGCMCCEQEAKKLLAEREAEYARQFPNGPECVTIPMEKIGLAKDAIGADALIKAFSKGGGGVNEVFDNLERLGFGRPKPLEASDTSAERSGE